ncbi:MAG: heavy-metal-associated domain-containing protein [Nanoarchaeota archaeon]|nr:heavy-metal-associated domain-containing protein [Nanoarchaeota archaeon]
MINKEDKVEEAKEGEYVHINMKVIVVGLIAGVIASLWTIIPFFVGGVSNLLYATVSIGLLFLIFFAGFKKGGIIKSGGLAIGVFLLMSYLLVPFVSGFLLNNNTDISQINTEGLETVNLALPGLFCGGCAYSSENALKGMPGVVDARVDFDSKSGVVVYDPNLITPETIVSNGIIQVYGGRIVNG